MPAASDDTADDAPDSSPPGAVAAFEAFEATGWESRVDGYDAFFRPITTRTVDALLDAVRVGPGDRLLDVATGPGLVAGRAAERGATAVGVDIAHAMVAVARRRWPDVAFRRADAHALPFPDGSFDAATGNFAILHFGRPEQAVRELARVLVPGGRVALTVWDLPERAALFGAVLAALEASGAQTPPDIPDGPAFFRFSEDDELEALLGANGFAGVTVTTLAFTHRVAGIDDVWDGVVAGSVRTSALIERQPAATRARVRQALTTILERYRRGHAVELPISVKLAGGQRLAAEAA